MTAIGETHDTTVQLCVRLCLLYSGVYRAAVVTSGFEAGVQGEPFFIYYISYIGNRNNTSGSRNSVTAVVY